MAASRRGSGTASPRRNPADGVGANAGWWAARLGVRIVPWLIAAAGLGVPLLAGGFAGWPYVLMWADVVVFDPDSIRDVAD